MAMNTQMSELKKRALLAKQRMRMGYWQAMSEEKAKKLEELGDSFHSVQLVKGMQLAKFERDQNRTLGRSDTIRDEALFLKVCTILDEDEDVMNPLGRLVEHEVYDNLDEGNRQKYILDLSKKFCAMKERYYRERLGKARGIS
ncbi:MAG: hypothetical protein FWD58_03540 [Firmicutes bacterium]|nr:hypothetical protein [Bacillota bacterium]